MNCRNISCLICTLVAVATAIGYSGQDSNTGSHSEATVHRLRIHNPESSTTDPLQDLNTAVDLGALLDAGKGAVVVLVAGDTRLVAHRAVLSARSPVFQRILQDAATGEVAIPDVEGPVLRQLLSYLYTLQAPQLPPGMAPQLLAAADQYDLPALKADCEQQVVKQLSVQTAAATAVLAVRRSYDSLREATITFIRGHIFQVMATQGWAEAINTQPQVMIKVMQLLSQSPAETSSSTPVESGASPCPTTRPHSDLSGHCDHQTPATATPTVPGQTIKQTVDDCISLLRIVHNRHTSGSQHSRGPWSVAGRWRGRCGGPGGWGHPPGGAQPRVPAHPAGRRHWRGRHPRRGWPGATPAAQLTPVAATSLEGYRVSSTPVESGASPYPTTRPHSDLSGHSDHQTPATATPTVPAQTITPTVHNDNCLLRSLSAEEKNRRLMEVAEDGAVGELEALLAAGADVGARDRQQWTPLHHAAWRGRTAAVRLLLAAGADASARSESESTPLNYAARNGNTEVVAALLESGADRANRDQWGDTPLDDARRSGHQKVVELLQQTAARHGHNE